MWSLCSFLSTGCLVISTSQVSACLDTVYTLPSTRLNTTIIFTYFGKHLVMAFFSEFKLKLLTYQDSFDASAYFTTRVILLEF